MSLTPNVKQIFTKAAKDHLDKEIKQSFENLEAIPYAKKCQEANFKIKSVVEATVLKRLEDMYEDPRFGPSFFVHITKWLRSCLPLYRMSKNNPELGHFFMCSKVAPGVILHFNSVTRKNEILFLLTKGDNSREKPVKLGINTILKWHRKRKANARLAQLKHELSMLQLENAAIEADNNFMIECRTILSLLKKSYDFSIQLKKDLMERKRNAKTRNIKTRYISAKKPLFLKLRKSIQDLDQEVEGLYERQNNFDSLNPKMFERKDFLNMKIDHFKSLTMTCLILKSKSFFKFLEATVEND